MRTTTAFAAWREPVRGLDFLFTLGPAPPPLGCLPLSLYTFSTALRVGRAWLGVTPPMASPNLTGDRAEVSLCAAQCRISTHRSRLWAAIFAVLILRIEPNELPDCSTPRRDSNKGGRPSQGKANTMDSISLVLSDMKVMG